MDKRILSKYNHKDCLIVISGYPKKAEIYSQGVCAVSSFAKNTILRLQKENPGRKIIVLTIQTIKNEIYEEDGVLVIRCFRRNSPLSYLAFLNQIIKFRKPKDVLVEFEFASFGDTITTSLMVPFLFALLILGKNIFLVMHQVLFDIKLLSGHIGIKENSPKLKFLNFGLRWFYFLLALPAKKIVVLEEEFKKRLSKVVNHRKIIVIPHGVDTNIRRINKLKARKKFGIKMDEFALLYFGYLTWYKGVDFLISALKNIDYIGGKKIKLVIAGGPSFTQRQKTHYQIFLKRVSNDIKRSRNILTIGFVDEKDITPIFEAADLAILPYRTFMSSSGPLSLAISHKKPFIISDKLSGLLESSDIRKAMALSKVKRENIIFKMNKNSLIKIIEKSIDSDVNNKISSFSVVLNKERSFDNIARIYNNLLSASIQKKLSVFSNALSLNKN